MENDLIDACSKYFDKRTKETAKKFADALCQATFNVGYIGDRLIVESDSGYEPMIHAYLNKSTIPVDKPFSSDPAYREISFSIQMLMQLMADEDIGVNIHGMTLFPISVSFAYLSSLFEFVYGAEYVDLVKSDSSYHLQELVGYGVSKVGLVKTTNYFDYSIVYVLIECLPDVDYNIDSQLYKRLVMKLNQMFSKENAVKLIILKSVSDLESKNMRDIVKHYLDGHITFQNLIDDEKTFKYLGIKEVRL